MARPIAKAKTSRVDRATTPGSTVDVSAYCCDLDKWPRSWMGLEKDLPPGEQTAELPPAFYRVSGIIESFPEDHSSSDAWVSITKGKRA